MTVSIKELINLFVRGYDYLLIVDSNEKIVFISNKLAEICSIEELAPEQKLEAVSTKFSLDEMRKGIEKAIEGKKDNYVFWKNDQNSPSIPLKVSQINTDTEQLFFFWSNKLPGFDTLALADWEKIERIKELTCLYAVAEWIQTSNSTQEFFKDLPKYIKDGMHYPESTMVYSKYMGAEYGEMPTSKEVIQSEIMVKDALHGEIIVGYDSDKLQVLPEEQKMLDEIVRMLGIALDRNELIEKLDERNDEVNQLEMEINLRSKEIDKHNVKLKMLDSYLKQANKGFSEASSRLETMFAAIPDMIFWSSP